MKKKSIGYGNLVIKKSIQIDFNFYICKIQVCNCVHAIFTSVHCMDYFADPEWASCNIGVFLCTTCAAWHRRLGTHVTKVKSLKLDK